MSLDTIAVISVGPTGDARASRIASHIHDLSPTTTIVGAGGSQLGRVAHHLLCDTSQLSVWDSTGLTAQVRGITLGNYRPQAWVFVDSWRVVPVLRSMGLLANGHRVACFGALDRESRRDCSPIVAEFLEAVAGLAHVWVSTDYDWEHALLAASGQCDAFWLGHWAAQGAHDWQLSHLERHSSNRLVLLPGGRAAEVEASLPVFLAAARIVCAAQPRLMAAVCTAPDVDPHLYARLTAMHFPVAELIHGTGASTRYRAMHDSAVALVCSGTAALEAAMLGTPMVVAYDAPPHIRQRYVARRALGQVPELLSLPNVILGSSHVPELLAEPAPQIALAVLGILRDASAAGRAIEVANRLASQLCPAGAERRLVALLTGLLKVEGD